MQHIENDMDDLFRRAAENYPLKTEAKNWDDIAAALVPSVIADTSGKKQKKRTTWFLLLGFLFLASAVSFKIFHTKGQSADQGFGVPGIRNENTIANNTVNPDIPAASTKNNNVEDLIMQPDGTTYRNIFRHKTAVQKAFSAAEENMLEEPSTNKGRGKKYSTGPVEIDTKEPKERGDNFSETEPFLNAGANQVVSNKSGEQKKETTEKEEITVNDTLTGNIKGRLKPEVKNPNVYKNRFYIAAVAGPQINQVKGQGFTKAGLSAGILIGYNLKKRTSVETGFLFSKKHYFSDGKYFDMSKAATVMPPNMKVISLNGSSNIFEIPLKVKYDFIAGKKTNWFVTSGVSSYILTSERNDYFALISGVQQNLNSGYGNKRIYFAATVNLSIGSEFKLGAAQTKIRIEPYLQMPLHGIGIGAMPVYTTGLHVGISLPMKK